MTDKRRSSWVAARTGAVFLLVLILSVALVAVLRLGTRAPPPASMAASAGVARASLPAAQRAAARAAAAPDTAGGAQICGFGYIAINKDESGAIDERVGNLTKATGSRWLSALQNSGDLRARAAGLLLQGKLTGGEPLRPVTEQTRDAIVQLAAGTVEPPVYAVALSMCGTYSGTGSDPACQQLSLQHWSQIDPNNAVPWLLLADDARRRHSAAEEAIAFARAASATKVDSYSGSLYAFAAPELPADVTPLERAYFAVEVIGLEAAMVTPHYAIANRHCSVDGMRDTNVRQQCNSLAELLVGKASGMLDLSLGKAIGTRVGWRRERLDELSDEQDAMMEVVRELTPSNGAGSWDCESVGRVNGYMDQWVRVGEVAAANDLLQRSGSTVPEMAQKYRQFLEDIRRNAAPENQ